MGAIVRVLCDRSSLFVQRTAAAAAATPQASRCARVGCPHQPGRRAFGEFHGLCVQATISSPPESKMASKPLYHHLIAASRALPVCCITCCCGRTHLYSPGRRLWRDGGRGCAMFGLWRRAWGGQAAGPGFLSPCDFFFFLTAVLICTFLVTVLS